jgi:hypothetical protein
MKDMWEEHAKRTQRRANFERAVPFVDKEDRPRQGRSVDNTGMRRGR